MGKNILIFLAGALSYQILLIALTGEYAVNDDATKGGRFGVSTAYFKGELSEVCDYLENKDCSCVPYVETELKCKADMNTFISSMYQNLSEEKIKKGRELTNPHEYIR